VNGGNALTSNGTLGTTTNFSVLFKTNNSERGRITNNGLWGFVFEKEYASNIAMLEDRISKIEAIVAPVIAYKKSKCFNSTY